VASLVEGQPVTTSQALGLSQPQEPLPILNRILYNSSIIFLWSPIALVLNLF